jgi:cytochrome c-type protein NapC/trimethylamine-N-oxide reductase cytochrome c-type subunit TorC
VAKRIDTTEGTDRSRPRRALLTWGIVLLALAVLLVVALEVTAQPWFCGTCHEMKPAYQGWLDGSHHVDARADCMDCHADPGLVGYFQAHVVAGLRDVYVHFIKGPPEQVADSYVPQSRCLKCHEKNFEDPEFTSEHVDKTEYCPDCHREEIHTNDRPQ